MLDWTDDDPPVDKEKAKLQRLLDDLNKWEPVGGWTVYKSSHPAEEIYGKFAPIIPLSCEPCRGTGTIRWVNETSTFTWPWAAACPWCRGEGTAREVIERRGVK